MDTYKLKWTPLQQRIFRFFAVKSGKNFNFREIARTLKVSPTAVSKSTYELEKEGILNIQESKNLNLKQVSLNRDNEKVVNLKRAENLFLFYESGIHSFLQEKFPGCAIILFGSYSRGEDVWFGEDDDKNSDIDIAIIGAKNRILDLLRFEKFFERDIFINYYDSWGGIHRNLKNNLLNGIVISGGVEL